MSVARKTPKFAENPYFKSPLRPPRKSTSPSPSRMAHSSPFSHSVKVGARNSGRNSPYSTATLKESVEALRQLRDHNNSINGSGSKDLRDVKDTKATIYDKKEFDIITDFERKHTLNDFPPPMRQHISKVEAFIASRMPKKEEDPTQPHNLAWRAASHDAQSRLLKEGATANQWPAANLLDKMGGLYNKFVDTGNEGIVKESPMRKIGMSTSTRKSTRLEEDPFAMDLDRYNKENQFSYGRRLVKEPREGRLSYTSTSSKHVEEYNSRGRAEFEKMKVEACRSKNQMKGKIDFINSLYEELALQPRDKPLMPSHRPVSPALDSRETPRSLRLMDDREIDESERNKRMKNEYRQTRENHENRSRDLTEERRMSGLSGFDHSINDRESATFGDEYVEEKRRPGSIQRAAHNRTPSNLSIPRKISTSNTSSLRSLQLAASDYEGQENSNRAFVNQEFPVFEENFNKGGDTERRRENNRPPLPMPAKKQPENDSRGFEQQQDWTGDKGTPLQKSKSIFNPEPKSTKNFIEMNKTSSAMKSKKYANYEKVLRNVEETCKPLLETLKKMSTKNEKELSIRCTMNRKGMWSPCSAVSSGKKETKRKNNSSVVSPMKPLNMEGFGNTGSSIKIFYDEMNNLTSKITEAAGVMQKTLDQLERYKVEDTERGGRSARSREEHVRDNVFGYGGGNEEESEIY